MKQILNFTQRLLTFSMLLLAALVTQAQVQVPFTQRTSAFTPTQTIYSINGDFTMIGNTNLTLQSYSNNASNDLAMRKVNQDSDPNTNNSSSATLTLSNENGANPNCSNVLFAGLYWSARTNSNTAELSKRQIKFKGPGESGYTSYTSSTSNIRYPGDNNMYVAFTEVTSQVQQCGIGEYWAADMALTEGTLDGTGFYGGWGLVVIYENPLMHKRDVTIFDGYAYMPGSQNLNFELPVSGFNSALAGAVNAKLGLMAGEGDVSIPGDKFEIQKLNTSTWQLLSHGGNTTDNFFNSSIFTGGNPRNPNLLNNTGMDVSMFNIPNPSNSVIANGQSNTKFRYSSSQDTYIIYSICVAIDAYEPIIEGFLSPVSVNGVPTTSTSLNVVPGDLVTYKVQIRNKGNEPVNNARLEIPLPYAAVTYQGSTGTAFAPASTSATPFVNSTLGANGTLVWDFGTLPVPADPNQVLGEVVFTLRVSEDCDLYRNFNCAAPRVDIDGTISGVGANTNIAVNDQPFYVGFSPVDGCSTVPVTGPFEIDINSTAWVAANCPAGDGVRDFSYCNRTTPISITEVLGNYPAGTRFFNVAGTTEYTIANPFPNVAGPTTYKAQLPGGGCQLTFTIAVTTITSVPSVAAGTLEYCQNAPAAALNATPSNASYTLFYYAPGNPAAQPSIIPATDLVGDFTYQVAEGPSSTCISTNRANIPVTILGLPTITATPQQPVCFGQTGSVVLASSGGTGALTYSAINPATSGLTAGSYTYSVSDSKNCRATATAAINAAPDQPAQPPIVNCWDEFVFNPSTCVWDNVGVQDPQPPVVNCWDEFVFNPETCVWDNVGVQDPQPPVVNCWDEFVFNPATCAWDNAGVQDPQPPVVNCWDNYQFNTASCQWENLGTQPVQREIECSETAIFNTASCEWDYLITESTIPSITAPGANATIECPNTPEFTAPQVNDECGEAALVVVSDITTEGDCAGTYSRTITWKAVDNFGNESAPVSQTITVTDTTDPVIDTLTNGEISCGDGVNFEQATATDNCDSDVSLSYEDEIVSFGECDYTTYSKGGWGSTSASTPGQYRDNNFDAAFPSGLTIGCEIGSFTFTNAQAIEDYIPSGGGAAVLPLGNTVNPSAVSYSNNFADQLAAAVLNVTFDAFDESFGGSDVNLGDLPFASGTFAGMTANQVIAIANDAIGGCGASYSNVDLSAAMESINLSFHEGTENSGALVCGSEETECSYTAIRTWTATDNCGNTSTATQTITVVDNVAPVISAAGESNVIYCPATPEFTAPTATDNCSEVEVIVIEDATYEGDCAGTYSRTITWAAEDACGNRSENVSQTITVVDITAPSISLLCGDTTITCPSEPVFAQPTASDDCDNNPSIIVISDETVDGPCAGTYARTIVWAAQDACGNMSEEVSQTITVVDETAPTISAAGESTAIECPATPEFTAPTATDDCDSNPVVELISDETLEGECAGTYTRTQTWVAYDACGNYSETVSQTITVVDVTAPSISLLCGDTTITCPSEPVFAQPTASDDCDSNPAIIVVSDETVDGPCAGTYARTIVWAAQDACGNMSEEVSQTITVVDETAPTISAAGESTAIECPATPEFTAPTATDDCDSNPVLELISDETLEGECAGTYTRTQTWVAYDACGNYSETVSQTITVVDVTAPSISLLCGDTTITCPSEPVFAQPTASDDCDSHPAIIVVSDETVDGSCAGTYARTIVWAAQDACGNMSEEVSQTITVVDETAPTISAAGESTAIECPATPEFTAPTATDDCDSNPAITCVQDTIYPGTCAGSYVHTKAWVASDACGNFSEIVSQTITVVDNTAPSISSAAADITIQCPAVAQFTAPNATDNCSDVTIIPIRSVTVNGVCPGTGITTVTWVAEDACGNLSEEVSQTITVVDTTAPVWTAVYPDMSITCPEQPQFDIPTASDACSVATVIEVSDVTEEGECAGSYTRTKTWKAVDACGNESQLYSQSIEVIDTTAPSISAAGANATIECPATPEFTDPTANDSCSDAEVVVVSDVTTEACGNTYSRTITWKAVDACGNESDVVSQTITVEDSTDPEFTFVPANYTVACAAEVAFGEPTATDSCNDVVISYSDEAEHDGDRARDNDDNDGDDDDDNDGDGDSDDDDDNYENCNYSITRTWTASDACGNKSYASQTIVVNDNIDPVFTFVPADYTVACASEVVFGEPTATDNCGSVTITIDNDCDHHDDRSRDEDGDDDDDDDNESDDDDDNDDEDGDDDSDDDDDNYEHCNYTVTRSWTATDNCGNKTTIEQTITVNDNIAPTVAVEPTDVTVECGEDVPAYTPVFTDNCDEELALTAISGIAYDGCTQLISQSWTATDDCGNSTTVSRMVTIEDTTVPSISAAGADATIECPATPEFTAPTAYDSCSDAEVVVVSDVTTEACGNTYSRTITWKAVDACGNESETVSQTINVVDNTAPSISAAGADANIECPASPEFTAPTANDTCGDAEVVVVSDVTTEACGNTYSRTISWKAVDACGNESETVSQTINVVDNTAPSISAAGADANIECPATPEFTAPTANDSCSEAEVVVVSDVTTEACGNTYSRTITWKAVDACGNESAVVSQTIIVEDTTVPSISAAGENATIECPATPEFTAPTANDSCSDAEVVVVSDVTTEACGNTYSRTITWKAVDACGNESAVVSQTITVEDSTDPEFTYVPANYTVACAAEVAFGEPTATDSCNDVAITYSDEANHEGDRSRDDDDNDDDNDDDDNDGDDDDNDDDDNDGDGDNDDDDDNYENCNYSITRTWTASDACGNKSYASQTIVVNDNIDPVFTFVPADYTVACASEVVFGEPTATDNCGSVTITIDNDCDHHNDRSRDEDGDDDDDDDNESDDDDDNDDEDGDDDSDDDDDNYEHCNYTVVRTWIAKDNCGNETVVFQTITVNDNIAPTVAVEPTDVTVECGEDVPAYTPVFTDNCDGELALTAISGIAYDGCTQLISQSWTATDDCGNSTTVSRMVTIEDTTNPIVVTPVADQFVECGDEIVYNTPVFSDLCDASLTVTSAVDTTELPQGIVITRTFTATDDCGNSVTDESSIVIAIENDPLLLNLPELNIQVSCDSIPQASIVIGEDVCGNELVVDFNEEIIGDNCSSVITRTWTAVDSFGNESSYTQTITVTDETAPVISAAGADATISCPAQPVFTAPTAADNCNTAQVVVVSDITEEGECAGAYTRTKTWKAVDACGNESEYVSQTITVVDNAAPVVDAYSMEITVHCDQIPNIPVLTATDACSDVIVDYTDLLFSGGCPGTTERNYTFTDACGNVAEATQFITIIDTVAPVFTFVPEQRFFACGEAYTAPTAAQATDICDSAVEISFSSTSAPSDCPQQQLVINTWTAADECLNEISITVIDVITICPEIEEETACDQYEWFGDVYTASGSYTHTEIENGCDIVYALDLTINESSTNSFDAEACVSYTWNGVPYTVSGDYTQVFENAAGCDSTVTLYLTINQPSSSQQSATACGSYHWNDQTYSTSGVYQFLTINAAGCDSTVTLTLTINTPSVAATSINVTPSASIVSGNSVVLTVNGGSLGTGAVWKWYRGTCGGTFVGTGNSITVSPTSTTTYFVRAEGLCNTTACVSRTITVTPPCGPQSVVSNAPNNTTCYGTAVTLTVGGTLQSGGSWKWYKNACGGICVGSGMSLVVMPTSTTTYYVRSEGGTCGTTTCMSITVIVNHQPARPSYITGLTSGLCNRTGVTYCTPAVSGATSYQWSVPTGATIVSGQGTTCITVNFNGSLGSNSVCGYAAICVRAVNSCGLSQARCVNLSVAPSGYATVSGLTYVNHGSTTTYSVGTIAGATNYTWTVPSGWQIVSGQGTTSITVIVGSNSGNVSVVPSNACANGLMIKKYVIVTCWGRRDTEVADIIVPEVNIYPNPANDYFVIDSGDAIPVYVEVMDMTGKVVFNGSQIRQVEVNNWTNGIYFVRMYFENEIQTKRIEIMH